MCNGAPKVMNLRFACTYHKAETQSIGIGEHDTSDFDEMIAEVLALLDQPISHSHQDLNKKLWTIIKKTI